MTIEATHHPAYADLVDAMARLSRRRRTEIVLLGRRAQAAKLPLIRQLAIAAAAEARLARAARA